MPYSLKNLSFCGKFFSVTGNSLITKSFPAQYFTASQIKYFAGIEDAGGIQHAPKLPQDAHLGVARKLRQEALFGDSDPMLPGNGASQADCLLENLFESLFHTMHLLFVSFIRQECR